MTHLQYFYLKKYYTIKLFGDRGDYLILFG